MKYLLIVALSLVAASCKKDQPLNHNEPVDIIYELQTNVTGFKEIRFGRFASNTTSSSIVFEKWRDSILAPGIYRDTVSIPRGFIAEMYAKHLMSSNWVLRIRSASGTVLKESGAPAFVVDSNYYFGSVSASAQ